MIDYPVNVGSEEEQRRSKRYLRDMQMLGLEPQHLSWVLRELLDTVEPGAVDWSRA